MHFGIKSTLKNNYDHTPKQVLSHVCLLKSCFREITFQTFLCLFALEKLVNGKHFPVKEKFGLVFRKVFSWKIWTENTFRKL